MDKNRKILAGCLIAFILIASILTYTYRDVIFLHKMSIMYPDGCVEEFENGELITPECIEGRLLKEQQNVMNTENYDIGNNPLLEGENLFE